MRIRDYIPKVALTMLSLFAVPTFIVLAMLIAVGVERDKSARPTDDGTIYLRVAFVQNSEHPSALGAAEFARMVKEKTDGGIIVELVCSGVLGSDESSIAEQVRFGGIDMACVSVAALTEYEPELELLQTPYLISGEAHLHAVLDSDYGKKLLSSVRSSGLVGLAFYDEGSRGYFNVSRALESAADMEGLRVGVQKDSFSTRMIELLGAQAVQLDYGDIYRSLRTGRINALEDTVVSYARNRYYAEAKYVSDDHHSYTPSMLICSAVIFDELNGEQKAAIIDAAEESVEAERKYCAEAEKRARSMMNTFGCEVTEISYGSAFKARLDSLYFEFEEKYPKQTALIRAFNLANGD